MGDRGSALPLGGHAETGEQASERRYNTHPVVPLFKAHGARLCRVDPHGHNECDGHCLHHRSSTGFGVEAQARGPPSVVWRRGVLKLMGRGAALTLADERSTRVPSPLAHRLINWM